VADAAYPAARVAQIVQTMTPAFVLLCGDSQHLPERDLLRPTTGVTDESPQVVRVPPAPDQALRQFPCRPAALPAVDPGQPAYITFTSGSTGVPKGVVTHHAPLVHFIEWHVQRHGFTRDDCFSLLSGLGHDPVYRDVFTPLSIGAKVVCPPQSTLLDPARLAAWIHGHGITAMHLTPPLGKLVAAGASSKARVFERLRYLFWGGDALSPVLFEQIRRAAPNATQVNFYGTTETPQAMAFHQLDGPLEQGRAPLGKGIDGAQLLVVNGAQQLAGEGEAGEILIRSPYLSLGYWGDTALTAEKFVINPFTGALGDI
ncbi:AMP-binding protein, partial [Pseudomonas sp. UBA800]